MSRKNNKNANLRAKCRSKVEKNIKTCYYPGCNEESINSHILQKNGILNKIAKDGHLWEIMVDEYSTERFIFKRKGLNKIFSFNCFCNHHDSSLFKQIESTTLDFTNYKTNLLFTLRTLYNEMFKKQKNIKIKECLIRENPDKFDIDETLKTINDENLAIKDLQIIEQKILHDLDSSDETFIFNHREIDDIGLCLSSFFTYDTTEEIERIEAETGKELDRYSEIFINIFPYQNKAILMTAYEKIDKAKVENYISDFYDIDPKICHQKITNLALFNCENWVINDDFYTENIKGIEYKFIEAVKFALYENTSNKDERKNFDISFYEKDFKDKFKKLEIK